MSPTQRLVLGAYAAIVAAWPIRFAVVAWVFRRLDYLTLRSPRYSQPDAPLVTAIIPAKDEEDKLADCLASVVAQTYSNLEIIVVDDRSVDGTAAIARRFEAADPRVRVVTIRDLPAGWTGKTHALHVAAAQAKGDWLWFVDADTRHHPDSLAIVMEYARVHGAAMASLLPEMRCETFWEKLVQPLAGIVLMRSYPLHTANDPARRLAFANGQYILIERPAYEAAGGHEAVRDKFVEDIHMAYRVKALGLSSRTAIGTEIGSTRMYTTLGQIVRGWGRILYDALGRRPWPLLAKVLEPLVFSQTGDLALLVALGLFAAGRGGAFAGWLLGLSLIHQVLKQALLYRMYRLNSPRTARYALLYPLAGLVTAWLCLRAVGMCRTGRVTWRGTSYGPAAEGAG
ncbi:MAG TPA: glycosyltransferase [Isosphaeraceae bacterium]|jgi:hypothetical protein|nr:glycosyltransferase [Isosphaeraceae bacterium]